jgi:hypothetical protein
MFMHNYNSQLAADRMHSFETQAAQSRLGAHVPAAELNHPRKQLLHRVLAASTVAGAAALLVAQTAPAIRFH